MVWKTKGRDKGKIMRTISKWKKRRQRESLSGEVEETLEKGRGKEGKRDCFRDRE